MRGTELHDEQYFALSRKGEMEGAMQILLYGFLVLHV